jgi:hypothetical protein
MLAVDDKKAFSGAQSVRFTHQGAPAVMFIELRQPVLPLPGHVMHGRLMYYLTQGPTGQYTHWEIVRGGGPLPGGARAQYNTGGENGKFVVNYEPGDCTKYSKVDFPMKRWACYQWEFNGPKNEIHLWIDGTPWTTCPSTGRSAGRRRRSSTPCTSAGSRTTAPSPSSCGSTTSPSATSRSRARRARPPSPDG